MELMARTDAELQVAHEDMKSWCLRKVSDLRGEINELEQIIALAREQKFKSAPFKRKLTIAKKRIVFYGKILAAVKEGYYIVPNFDMQVFAIRRDTSRPPTGQETGRYWENFPLRGGLLPAGEGETVSALPTVLQREVADGETTKTVYWPDEWDGEIEFPLQLAKPVIMEQTARALKHQIFDEVGMADGRSGASRNGDPMILGRIRNPQQHRADVTFFIAWYLDMETL